ncbi:MAG: hypothetical protein DMF11_05015 [Verrucomicrobia bacterium]|nr:MAG: hypothetical protein DMF11_05015 [Verrucomicrobiota bacterium]
MRAALIEERRRHKIRIAGIDGWAARQQRMRQSVPAVNLQRPKDRIGLDLVAGAGQNPESIVATKVVAKRHDYAVAIVINIRTCVTSIQNRVSDLKVVKVYNAAREKHRRVIADGAISDNQRPGIEHRAANL